MEIYVTQFGTDVKYDIKWKNGVYAAYYKGRLVNFDKRLNKLMDFLRG